MAAFNTIFQCTSRPWSEFIEKGVTKQDSWIYSVSFHKAGRKTSPLEFPDSQTTPTLWNWPLTPLEGEQMVSVGYFRPPLSLQNSGLLPPLSLAPSVLPAFLSGLHSWGLAPGSLLALGFNSKTFQSQWSSLITKWGCQGKNANWKLLFLEVLERLEINTFLLSIMPFA